LALTAPDQDGVQTESFGRASGALLLELLDQLSAGCNHLRYLTSEWRNAAELHQLTSSPSCPDEVKQACLDLSHDVYEVHAKLTQLGFLVLVAARACEIDVVQLSRALAEWTPWEWTYVQSALCVVRRKVLLHCALEGHQEPLAPTACPLILRGPNERPLLFNRPHDPVGRTEYKLLTKLVASWPGGLPKSELEQVCPSPNKVLENLRKKEGLWSILICLPGRRGRGGYRIVGDSPKQLPTISP
jgi:hypothetical protein